MDYGKWDAMYYRERRELDAERESERMVEREMKRIREHTAKLRAQRLERERMTRAYLLSIADEA